MPLKNVTTHMKASESSMELLSKVFNFALSIIKHTNQAIEEFQIPEEKTNASNNVLIYNVNQNERFTGLYQHFRKKAPEHVIYKNMDNGWDALNRQWSGKVDFLSPSELLELTQQENIKKIISINMHYLSSVLSKYHVYLPALLQYAGIEYVIIDLDTFELSVDGYMQKAFFSNERFVHFSVFPNLQKYWDDKYAIKNVHYIANPQEYGKEAEFQQLHEDYKVIILSHSRLKDLISSIPSFLQLWYYSLRHLMLEAWQIPEHKRVQYNTARFGENRSEKWRIIRLSSSGA